jgi:membrane protein implicated in regulation of membrane protease activity
VPPAALLLRLLIGAAALAVILVLIAFFAVGIAVAVVVVVPVALASLWLQRRFGRRPPSSPHSAQADRTVITTTDYRVDGERPRRPPE